MGAVSAGKSNSIAEAHMMDVEKIKVKLEELNQKLTDVCGDISEDLHHWADYQVSWLIRLLPLHYLQS